jgi:hypothetical protein
MTLPTMTVDKTRYLSCADTAKLVREQLKATFPGAKFSVRSDTYAGGASIDVSWTDGPLVADVDAAVKCFESRWFDGRDDSTHSYGDTLWTWPDGSVELLHFGSHYVMTHRSLSEDYLAHLETYAADLVAKYGHAGFSREATYASMWAQEYGHTPTHSTGHQLLWYLSQHVAAPVAAAPAKKRAARKK